MHARRLVRFVGLVVSVLPRRGLLIWRLAYPSALDRCCFPEVSAAAAWCRCRGQAQEALGCFLRVPSSMEAKQRPRHGEERRPPATDSGGGEEYDPWTAWLYKPHTISVLLVGACLLM
jgi:hypothetical protein